jgi:hypothetical protein
MNKSILAAAALALCSVTGSAGAGDSMSLMSGRAVSALGVVIAHQGNAALNQIRRDLKESALKTIEPFLPKPSQDAADDEPAETPVATR